jgi:hypothetical protein
VTNDFVRFKLLLGDYQIASASRTSKKAVASKKSERAGTMYFENEPIKPDCNTYRQQFCMPGGHAHGNKTQPHFRGSNAFSVPELGIRNNLDFRAASQFSRQKRSHLFVQNILSPNVGFTCKDVWRGPCESTVRDERLCLVQTLVILTFPLPEADFQALQADHRSFRSVLELEDSLGCRFLFFAPA